MSNDVVRTAVPAKPASARTFGDLRCAVLRQAKAKNLFEYRFRSGDHNRFWDEINETEYRRGYSDDYRKPNSPPLRDMLLLSQTEYDEMLARAPR